MRPIKFRAWVDNRFIYSGGKTEWLELGQFGNWEWNCESNSGNGWAVEADRVEEFTGLQDSKGKEIYEGDIISNRLELNEAAEVKFFEGAFWAGTKTYRDRLLRLYVQDDWEVVGNIYENPELIKSVNPHNA